METQGSRSRGRPKRRFMDAVKDMRAMAVIRVTEEDAEEREMEKGDPL